ncbi:MAG: hypothetical protein H7831_04585 [Magnetococcus sp. WYHC-3]
MSETMSCVGENGVGCAAVQQMEGRLDAIEADLKRVLDLLTAARGVATTLRTLVWIAGTLGALVGGLHAAR